jgi:photosystem II stability/assembly factor-like uncharacterized protein
MSRRSCWLPWLLLLCGVGSVWTQGGPPGGSVAELLQLAGEPLVIYAATGDGVLRSDDQGLSWSPTGERLRGVSVAAVAGTAEVLYAGTTEEGIFRSRDQGVTWEQINEGLDVLAFTSLAVDPSNADVVYAGSIGGGVFKTTNGGEQWAPSRAGLAEGVYLDIAIDPGNPQIVYAANASLQFARVGALFKSENGGQSWAAFAGESVFCVTLDPANPGTLYVGTSNGIVKTVNAGPPFETPVLQTFGIVDVAVDPGDPAVLYAATRYSRVVKSTDGGQTWAFSSQGMPRAELQTVTLNISDPSIVYAGSNDGGLFRSADAGANWDTSLRGMHFAEISALAVDPAQGNVMAAAPGGGAYRSINGGASWGPARGGMESFELRALAFDPTNPAVVYAGSVNPFTANDGSFLRSSDGGLQWGTLRSGFPFYAIAVHPSDGRTVTVGTNIGVFRSRDGGQTFSDISGPNQEAGLRIVDLVGPPGNPDALYAIVYDNVFSGTYQIYRTANGGTSWTGAGQTQIPLLDLEIDPNNPSRIYVAATSGIFRSTDGGVEYRAANNGFPDGLELVTSVAVDPGDNSAIYAATNFGVFRSTDGADSWQPADSGLEELVVLKLVPDRRLSGVIYAGTAGGGVFKTVNRGESWQPTGSHPLLPANGVVNGADFAGGGVAPGEIVSLFGLDLGPGEGVGVGLDPETGRLATTAAGVRVFFGVSGIAERPRFRRGSPRSPRPFSGRVEPGQFREHRR